MIVVAAAECDKGSMVMNCSEDVAIFLNLEE